MAKQPRVWTGSQWEELAVTLPDLSNYSTTTQMNTAIDNAKGLVLVNTTSFNAVSSISLNNVFSSTYENYRLMFKLSGTGNNVEINFRLRSSGTDDSGNNYIDQTLYADSTTVGANRVQSTGQRIGYIGSITRKSAITTDIFSPFLADYTNNISNHQSINSANDPRIFMFWGYHLQQVSYDGITIYPASGTITGTIRVYGYRNS